MLNVTSKLKCTLLASACLLVGSFLLQAQSSTTTTTVTGRNGKTATYQNNATWGNGNYTDDRSVTGPNGKTASENINRSNGQLTKTATGPNGHSRTYSHPVRRSRFR